MSNNLVLPEEMLTKKRDRAPLQLKKSVIELYGFSGKMGTGKNYIAEKLFLAMLPKKNTLVMALADHFKVECCSKDKIDYKRIFVNKDDESRETLQKRGTEQGRNVYGENIWVETLETWIRIYRERGVERFIITDLRFPNEVEWIKRLGGMTFRVEAPGRNLERLNQETNGDHDKIEARANHPSEVDLDHYPDFDYVIQNDYDDQPQVANQIRNIIRELIYTEPAKMTIFCDLDDTICHCRKFYIGIVDRMVAIVKLQTNISDSDMNVLLKKHIMSFERRYYTREDFANSLVKVTIEAHLVQDMIMNFNDKLRDQIYQLGLTVYNQNYDALYEDSLARVREMKKYGEVVIFTLGDHTEQMKKIVHLGLLDFHVEIFTHKDENMFRYLQKKYPSDSYVMIGDSYHRDIVPAMNAGIPNLVHISSNPLGEEVSSEMKDKIIQIERLNGKLMDFLQRVLFMRDLKIKKVDEVEVEED